MARLPDANTAFGGLDSMVSKRPIASYDDSAIARGGIAMGDAIDKGTDKLAAGFNAIAKDANEVAKSNDDLDIAKRDAEGTAASIALNSDFKRDTDYVTATERYEKGLNDIEQRMLQDASPRGQEVLKTRFSATRARGMAWITDQSFQREGQAQTGFVLEQGEDLIRKIPEVDGSERPKIIDKYHAMVDGLRDVGHVTPTQALSMKRTFADRYVTSESSALMDRDPASAVSRLENPQPNDIYSHLQPEQRQLLLNRARSNLHGEQYSIKGAIEDDVTSMGSTGQGVPGLTAERIRSAFGPRGDQITAAWQSAREDAGKIWTASHDFPSLTETEIYDRVDRAQPQAGVQSFTRQQAIHDALVKRADDTAKLRRDDPAKAVSADPEVTAARAKVSQANPESFQDLGKARMLAQGRLGIPDDSQSPITKDEALKLTVPLRTMIPGQERGVVTDLANQFQTMFGDNAEPAFSYALRAHSINAATADAAAKVITSLARRASTSEYRIAADQLSELGSADVAIAAQEREQASEAQLYGAMRLRALTLRRTGGATVPGMGDMVEVPGMPQGVNLPRRAITYLLANPDTADKFDAEYGKGAADRVLSYRPPVGGPAAPAPETPFLDWDIPRREIDRLRADPSRVDKFNERFGAGAAAKILERYPARN